MIKNPFVRGETIKSATEDIMSLIVTASEGKK